MKIKFLAKIGIISGTILVSLYVLFLILPFLLNIFIDKYTPLISGEINKATGLSSGIEEVRIVTSPSLSAGLKVKKFELYTPKKEPVILADNFEVRMSLMPILAKYIQVDTVKLDSADITLKFDDNGELELLNYLPKADNNAEAKIENKKEFLPFGFRLSNHLPNIHINNYKIVLTDGKDNYIINGGKTDVTDFIFNKSIKLKGSGKILLKDREQFNFNISLLNKIMPYEDINEILLGENKQENELPPQKINIINILRGLYEYKLTANTNIDLKTTKDSIDGFVDLNNISIIDLPASDANLQFKGNNINIDSKIYTAKSEISSVSGVLTTGKSPYVDLNVKSDLDITNVLNIVKKISLIFNLNELKTLTASGNVNMNFNIKSDLKTVKSSGFLKIPTAKMYYGAYKIGADNINADVSLADNNINIKNLSFSILNQPLKLHGNITSTAEADISVFADKLSLKGLLVALGQSSILKENPIYSGSLTMNAIIKGKLDNINPVIKLSIDNLDLKNLPSDLRLKVPATKIDINSDGKTFSGTSVSSNVQLINPAVTAYSDSIKTNIQPEFIEVLPSNVKIDKIRTTISGKILNYLTEKIGLDFVSTGDIKSVLKGDMNISKQTLNLTYSTTEQSEIIIPMFDKSKLKFSGKINITDKMTNPLITGSASVPSVSIPEIPVKMSDMNLKFNGIFLHGHGTVKEFETGGIKAQNLSSDFELKGLDFYLKNLKGDSFKGKVSGNIIYNLSNANTKISFSCSGLDAESAIEGASGIKNALSGTLGFNTNLTLKVLEYNAMMKSMKGNLDFNIKKGAFGTIGRFEGFLGASNITQNYFLKNTVNALSNAAGLATTAQFDLLEGKLTFSDGWANLNPVKSSGPSLAYYITGKYNLTNGTTNVNILGRLDAPMVAKLGTLGSLNMADIIGDKASNILKILTSNPQTERTELIPDLTNGSKNTQEFKVVFNGGVESKSSIKTFKWLKNADMTNLQKQTAKDVVKTVQEAYKTDIDTTKEGIKNAVETEKQKVQSVKEQINTTKEDFKNLWKNVKESSKQTKESTPTEEKPITTEQKATNEEVKSENVKSESVESVQKTNNEAVTETANSVSTEQAGSNNNENGD